MIADRLHISSQNRQVATKCRPRPLRLQCLCFYRLWRQSAVKALWVYADSRTLFRPWNGNEVISVSSVTCWSTIDWLEQVVSPDELPQLVPLLRKLEMHLDDS